MNVKRIVVDELPVRCDECPILMWRHKSVNENKVCAVMQKQVLYNDKMKVDRPSWCPLEIGEVCVWVGNINKEYPIITFSNNEHQNLIKLHGFDPRKFTHCPSCGKRIKYVEVE
jgi:hypothetical protein